MPSTPENPIHADLRVLRDDLVQRFNAKDWDGVSGLLTAEATLAFPDGRRIKGPEELKAYVKKMTEGNPPIVVSLKVAPEVDDLTTLYGDDTGIATGTSRDHYELAYGKSMDLSTRWTATMVKDSGGPWKIAALQIGADVFDNPILAAANSFGVGAALVTALIGMTAGYLFGRKRRA